MLDKSVESFSSGRGKFWLKTAGALVLASLVVSTLETNLAYGTVAYPDLTVTVADPGIQSFAASGLVATTAVETFDSVATGSNVTFTSSTVGAFSGTGTISNFNQYGGAGGAGRFMTASDVYLTLPSSSDYKYVGFWWSAGNSPNNVELLNSSNQVLARFVVDEANTTEDLLGVTSASGYTHNPNTHVPNRLTHEKYAFVHLRYPPGFRKVRFQGEGFEFDNVTISLEVPAIASTEVTTETFNPYTIATPSVLLADPKTGNVSFPGVTLGAGSGETNAMLCFSEVQSATAGAAAVTSASVDSSGSATGITSANTTNLRTFSGARATVISFSSNIDFIPTMGAQRFSSVGSRFIRVTATPQTNVGTAGCTGDAVVSTTIEIRFLRPYQSNSINIPID